MLLNIVIGSVLVVLTTLVHAGTMVLALWGLKISHAKRWGKETTWAKGAVVAALVLAMFLASLFEAGMWAVTYLTLGAISGVERALYFSTVTYTTLGYGDVTLEEHWRLLSTAEAANGIIIFGWTTALIVAAVQRLYFPRQATDEPRS